MMMREMSPSEARITEILLASAVEDSMPLKLVAEEAGVCGPVLEVSEVGRL